MPPSTREHVLVEKPAARRRSELPVLAAAGRQAFASVWASIIAITAPFSRRGLVDSGALGPLLFVRARYGHGGRPGYEREWRAQPELSGGGELIDQGVHLIDLARWFLGEFTDIEGFAHTYFWNMPVEDNGFMLLKTADKQDALLHASCTEWKNTFSCEIYGRDGKVPDRRPRRQLWRREIAYYRMLPAMGPPETTIWEYPMAR